MPNLLSALGGFLGQTVVGSPKNSPNYAGAPYASDATGLTGQGPLYPASPDGVSSDGSDSLIRKIATEALAPPPLPKQPGAWRTVAAGMLANTAAKGLAPRVMYGKEGLDQLQARQQWEQQLPNRLALGRLLSEDDNRIADNARLADAQRQREGDARDKMGVLNLPEPIARPVISGPATGQAPPAITQQTPSESWRNLPMTGAPRPLSYTPTPGAPPWAPPQPTTYTPPAINPSVAPPPPPLAAPQTDFQAMNDGLPPLARPIAPPAFTPNREIPSGYSQIANAPGVTPKGAYAVMPSRAEVKRQELEAGTIPTPDELLKSHPGLPPRLPVDAIARLVGADSKYITTPKAIKDLYPDLPNEVSENFAKDLLLKLQDPNKPSLHFTQETNETNGDQTITAFDPKTGAQVSQTVVKGAGKKRPTQASLGATGVSALTDDDLRREGEQLAITGQSAQLGNGSGPVKQAILHWKNEFARKSGFTPRDMATARAAFAGDMKSLGALQTQRDQIVSFEQTAQKNLDTFLSLAAKIPDTGVPWINTPIRALDASIVGSDNMAAINAARQVANNEIAKVTSGGGLGGVLSDSARHEVEGYNPASATLKQTLAVAKVLKSDMAARRGSMDSVIENIRQRVGSMGDQQGQASPSLPMGGGKKLDAATARKFYDAAGGDPAKARQMATQNNWIP